MFLELLDLAAENRGDIDDEGIQQQDEERQLPVHPEQYCCGAKDAQHGNNEFADADTDEIVDGLQIGDKMRRNLACTQRFVLGHGDTPQSLQERAANPEDDLFRNAGELARLPDTEDQGQQAQEECQ